MDRKTCSVCILVVVLGIAAAAAGFAAETTRVKHAQLALIYTGADIYPDQEPKGTYCTYPNSPAMGLAIAATVEFMATRVIIAANTGGYCSCYKSIPNLPKHSQVAIFISWITSSISVILFLSGAILNSKKGVVRESFDQYHCYVMRSGVFQTATVMGLVSVLLTLVYYLSYVSAIKGLAKTSWLEREAPAIADGKKLPFTAKAVTQIPREGMDPALRSLIKPNRQPVEDTV